MSTVAAIVLAAGESTRMGELKALLPWGSTNLLGHAIASVVEAGYAPVVVVLGHEAERLQAEVQRAHPSTGSGRAESGVQSTVHPEALEARTDLRVLVNERYREGRATSIVAGVEALISQQPGAGGGGRESEAGGGGREFDGLLIASVDQPRSAAMLRELREAWEAARPRPMVGAPALGGRAGHPALFDASLMDELLAVTEERQGLREVVARHRAARLLVPTDDPLALTNINTHDDYEQALKLV